MQRKVLWLREHDNSAAAVTLCRITCCPSRALHRVLLAESATCTFINLLNVWKMLCRIGQLTNFEVHTRRTWEGSRKSLEVTCFHLWRGLDTSPTSHLVSPCVFSCISWAQVNACSTFNVLNAEDRRVAAALIQLSEDAETSSK